MRLLIALILIMLSFAGGAPAIAHPLDASCLAQSKSSPVDCEALHDEGATKDQQRAALEELAQQQGKFPRAKANLQASSATIALNYFQLGFVHIIPKGLDHILFVLALFLGAKTWRQLLAQVSAFTFAHSVTLALTSFTE